MAEIGAPADGASQAMPNRLPIKEGTETGFLKGPVPHRPYVDMHKAAMRVSADSAAHHPACHHHGVDKF